MTKELAETLVDFIKLLNPCKDCKHREQTTCLELVQCPHCALYTKNPIYWEPIDEEDIEV